MMLMMLFAAIYAKAQTWYQHYAIPYSGGGTGQACEQDPDGSIWVGAAILEHFNPVSGQIFSAQSGGNVQGLSLDGGFFFYTRVNNPRLKRMVAAPPYTQNNVAGGGFVGNKHLAHTAGGDYILVVPAGWRKYNSAHALVDENAAAITWQSPKGVVIDEASGTFKVSDTGAGLIYEFSLATGDSLGVESAASPTGLFLFNGELLVASANGTISQNGAVIVSDPTRVFNDVWRNDTLLVAVDETATLVFKTYPPAPMPITLKSFEVEANGKDGAVATAVTATEVNNQWMILEHSRDGKVFKETSRQAGAGNSSAEKVYTFEVNGLSAGTHYFRLKQIDYDGQFSYSELRSLQIKGDSKFAVYPNPAAEGGWITVTLPEGAEAVVVFSLAGQWICEITTGEIKLPAGDYVFRIRERHDAKKVVVR